MYWDGINDMLQSGLDSYREDANGDYVRDVQNKSKESYIYIGKGLGTHKFFSVSSTIDESMEIFLNMINDVKAKGLTPFIVKGTGKYYPVHGNDKIFYTTSQTNFYMHYLLPAVCVSQGVVGSN